MGAMTRDDLAERLREMKRQAFPRCSLERLNLHIVPDDDATWPDLIEQHVHAELIDVYLRGFVAPGEENPCPCCGARSMFDWGLAHGQGYCYCGWPATLLHYVHDRREDDDLVCAATVNGHRVCEAPRGEHVPTERTTVGSGDVTVRVELRCPSPSQPPGLQRPVTAEYRPPEILRMTRLLWAHPYAVHLT